MASPSRGRRAARLVAELVVVASVLIAALQTFGAAKAKTDGDEAEWVGTSRYFLTLFVERDISPEAWPDSYWTRTQPMVARYVIGAWLWAHGHDLTALDPRHDHSKNWAQNQRAGTAPSNAVLDEARRSMRLLAALTAVWLYLAVRVVAGPVGGVAAALLMLGSPYLNEHLIRAKGDATLMFFWVAALAVLLAGVRRPRRHSPPRFILAALGGALLGLAFGSKLTAVLGILAVAIWTAGAAFHAVRGAGPAGMKRGGLGPASRLRHVLRHVRHVDNRPASFGAVAIAMAAVTFVASNPFLYPDPVGRTWLLFQNRREEMAVQMATEPHRAVTTVQDRIHQTLDRSLYNEAWGPSYVGYPVEAVLAVLGLGWLLVRVVRAPPRRPGAEELLLLWSLCVFGGVAWGLGYRLQHYFVPSAIVGLVLAGVGVGFTWRRAWRAARARLPAPSGRLADGRSGRAAEPASARLNELPAGSGRG